MSGKRLATRTFTLADQNWFAALSADRNPIHVDPLAARRMLFGDIIVHGVHAALWALESYLQSRPSVDARVCRIRCQFTHPIHPGDAVTASYSPGEAGGVSLQVSRAGAVVVSMDVQTDPTIDVPTIDVPAHAGADQPCQPRTFAQLAGAGGSLPLFLDPEESRLAFPAVLAAVGRPGVAAIVALSRLVGMECPGMHSLFSAFSVELGGGTGPAVLTYQVTRADVPVAPVKIEVSGPAARGTVTTFFRPQARAQADMQTIAPQVAPGNYAGQRVLVVGGSRGLGEVTAKIIACGGGHPIITFHSGQADAERVQQEITAAGATCETLRLDVLRPQAAFRELRRRLITLTHLYYFATPRITRARSAAFEAARLKEFMAYYVDAFYRICQLGSATGVGLRAFYPSTIFVGEGTKENPEYMIAKAAGEALCGHLARFGGSVSVLMKRLPRIATDQTVALIRASTADAVATMLPIVGEMR